MEKDVDSIASLNRIRVAGRKENGQQPDGKEHDAQQKEPPERPEILPATHSTEDVQWWSCQLEIGGLLVEKRNIELALYTQVEGHGDANEADRAEQERELVRIHQRIAELERRLTELDARNHHAETPLPPTPDHIDDSIRNLEQMGRLYQGYHELTDQEGVAIDREDFPTLSSLMKTKQDLLERIRQVRESIDFPMLQALEDGSEKKAKASEVLSDINLKIRQILDKENLNSVELQNRKEEVRNELARHRPETRAISRYAVSDQRPHFVDTKK